MKAITYRRDALRALQRMPRPTAERIVAKIEAYAIDPASQANNVKALKGEDAMRLRVGDWRVIMLDGEVEAETITISRAEYDRLVAAVEELEDLRIVERARANPEEGMPHTLVVRLVAGESPVRLFREWRGLSGAELARRAGVNVVQLHDIETGKRRGSVDTLKKLAVALQVALDDIA